MLIPKTVEIKRTVGTVSCVSYIQQSLGYSCLVFYANELTLMTARVGRDQASHCSSLHFLVYSLTADWQILDQVTATLIALLSLEQNY